MFGFKRRRKRRSSVTKHYVEHKEIARSFIHARITHWNAHYGFTFNRVSIRNPKTCWGSCTSKKNLNFSYWILFLPEELQDYIVVHELCHLEELNHSKNFWSLMEKTLPDYKERKKSLRKITHAHLLGRDKSVSL